MLMKQKDEEDAKLLQEKLDKINDKWEAVCGKSVDRQQKLQVRTTHVTHTYVRSCAGCGEYRATSDTCIFLDTRFFRSASDHSHIRIE